MASSSQFNIFASVPTGLEIVALDEFQQRIAPECSEIRRGKVLLRTSQPFERLLELRSVFRLFAYLGEVDGLPLDETGPQAIKDASHRLNWEGALALWRGQNPGCPETMGFRATVRRSGGHAYTSVEAAGALGAAVQQQFGWPVNLDQPQLEVFAQLTDGRMLIGITMTPRSLHRHRGIRFGRAGLKGPVAHCLARLANPQPGEVTFDPMCGVGTISLEAALLEPDARHIASDIDAAELAIAAENARLTGVSVELHQWDGRRVPLDDASVDAVICDLPFGRRVSSPVRNQHLYPPVFNEMARVLRPGGRAVVLTLERRLMNRQLNNSSHWRVREARRVYYGGLGPQVYMLDRV